MSNLSIVNIVFCVKCVHNASYTTKVIWLQTWSDFVPQDKYKKLINLKEATHKIKQIWNMKI